MSKFEQIEKDFEKKKLKAMIAHAEEIYLKFGDESDSYHNRADMIDWRLEQIEEEKKFLLIYKDHVRNAGNREVFEEMDRQKMEREAATSGLELDDEDLSF